MRTFSTFGEWRSFVKLGVIYVFVGVMRLSLAVVYGVTSVLTAVWRRMVSLVAGYPSIALGSFLVSILMVWLLTFAYMRTRAVGAEDRLGMVKYEYQQFKESHGYE